MITKGSPMKYVKSGQFSAKQFSMDETITELEDVITIATELIKNKTLKDTDLAIKNLKQAEHYLSHLRRKTKIALKFVPKETQEKEWL